MSFFEELKRRNVVRVGIAYAVIGWVLAQVAEFAFENFGAPDWVLKTFVVILLLGLPLALFFAWAFEITPQGVKREKDVDRSQSVTAQTGRKLDFIIIGVLVVAVGGLLADRFVSSRGESVGESVATTGPQSIAVLPFVNLSDDKDYFADGLSEELLNLLAQVPDLKVAGRTSSFAFKGRNEDFESIGKALKVEHVLEGSVRRSGETLRVTAQLIKVEDGYHLWSETYDRKMEDVFAIQDDVAGAIAAELKLRLVPTASRSTGVTEAYDLYLEVLANLEHTGGQIDQGIALLDRAIELDPQFAKAFEMKSMLYWLAGGWTMPSSDSQLLVYENAIKALALDPDLIVAKSFSVSADPYNWSWVREIEAIEEAVAATPNNIRAMDSLAYDYTQTGYFDDAHALALRMIELDPLSPWGYMRAGYAANALGRTDEAHSNWSIAAELGETIGHWMIVTDLISRGQDEEAIEKFERLLAELGQDSAFVRPLFKGARDPESGRENVLQFVADLQAVAPDFATAGTAANYLLNFGFVDDFWQVIFDISAQSEGSWTDADVLEHYCRVLSASDCASHPRAIEYARLQGLTELWDMRGAPDRCSKTSGEWACE